LPEAVAHVLRVDHCQPEDAQWQISNALASGDLWPLRWEDIRALPSGPTGGATMPDDLPSRNWSKGEIEEIDWEGGTAIDRSEFSPPGGQRRRLLIHRLRIAQWWPEPKGPPSTKRPLPTAAELDAWMSRVKRGDKRDDTINACRSETGARVRDAAAAWDRLPMELKLNRGQRTGLRKIEQ
jgi:hypothetical protein